MAQIAYLIGPPFDPIILLKRVIVYNVFSTESILLGQQQMGKEKMVGVVTGSS